jgi:polyphosphate kinase 2 (PPK2 family)
MDPAAIPAPSGVGSQSLAWRSLRHRSPAREGKARAMCGLFLHVSNKEQKRRFLECIEEPEKNWKFSANDAKER